MSEGKESKEDTIYKLSSLSWQRKLNERNISPKDMQSESDQFWKSAKPIFSDLRCSEENKKRTRQNQTLVFKTKNDLTPASKQNRNDFHYVKLQGSETGKVLLAVRETSHDQKCERQLKNTNFYCGQNYRKDEKENVNYQKNINRTNNPVNQNYLQNQKHFKRGNKNQDLRNMKNESLVLSIENGNLVKKHRNFTHHQSWNCNQNNRGYHRDQDKFNPQNNYHRSEAKNRNNYQNTSRNQNFHQDSAEIDQAHHLNESFKRNTGRNENSFSYAPSVSQSEIGIHQENSTPGIHYQRTFSSKTKNKTYTAHDSFSNQFTAGLSEPIPTLAFQNDSFRTNTQLNQSSNISVPTANQALIYNKFNDGSSYANEMVVIETPVKNDQHLSVDEFASNNKHSIIYSSLSPDVADFIPRKNLLQITNQSEYSDSLENLQSKNDLETRNLFSFSTPINDRNDLSQNTGWLSQNNSFTSDCNESIISGSEDFQPYAEVSTTLHRKTSSEELNNFCNLQQSAVRSVPETTSNIQTFNFNGRIVSLCDENTQNICPCTNEDVQNFYPYKNKPVGNRVDYSLNANSDMNNCLKNLNFNNQEISNILQIANLNLNQETASVPTPPNQRSSDILQMSALSLNEDVAGQTNASILSQAVANNNLSNQSVCRVMQNSAANNTMYDYYKNPLADSANCSKCDESVELNSKLEMVAQQLIDVNKYVSSPEINAETMTLVDSVSDLNSQQFNFATFQQTKENMEDHRYCGSFSCDNGNGSLLSASNPMKLYENLYTPTSTANCKSYDSFSTPSYTNSDFTNNEEPVFIGSNCKDGNPMNSGNNAILSTTQFFPSVTVTTSDANAMRDFQNYRRSNVQKKPDHYRQRNAANGTITPTQKYQTPFKNEFTRNNNNNNYNNDYGKRMFNNQVRITSNKPNSMTINVRDDCFINFNRKNRQTNSNQPKFNVTVGKPPSIGILKKSPKPVLDTTIQFQKSPIDQSIGDSYFSSKENSLLNKRVSFLLENDQ